VTQLEGPGSLVARAPHQNSHCGLRVLRVAKGLLQNGKDNRLVNDEVSEGFDRLGMSEFLIPGQSVTVCSKLLLTKLRRERLCTTGGRKVSNLLENNREQMLSCWLAVDPSPPSSLGCQKPGWTTCYQRCPTLQPRPLWPGTLCPEAGRGGGAARWCKFERQQQCLSGGPWSGLVEVWSIEPQCSHKPTSQRAYTQVHLVQELEFWQVRREVLGRPMKCSSHFSSWISACGTPDMLHEQREHGPSQGESPDQLYSLPLH